MQTIDPETARCVSMCADGLAFTAGFIKLNQPVAVAVVTQTLDGFELLSAARS